MQEYKVVIAGGRDFTNVDLLELTLIKYADDLGSDLGMSIVSGMARGADILAYQYAERNGYQRYSYPPDWDQYGKRAGFLRNEQMGKDAMALIAFWDGQSKGTQHMIKFMEKLSKPVTIISY